MKKYNLLKNLERGVQKIRLLGKEEESLNKEETVGEMWRRTGME